MTASSSATGIRPIIWADDHLKLIDQRVLPHEERWVDCRSAADVAEAIHGMAVRGAPAIGIAAAYGLEHLGFGPETLFDNLYLSTSYKPEPTGSGLWMVGSALVPLYKPLQLTLKPLAPPADPRRSAIYSVAANGGRAYVGGKWNDDGSITTPLKQFGWFRILTDTTAPKGSLISRAGGQLRFSVGDDLSGLASYRLLIGGQFRLLRFEHKKAVLFTIPGDTLGPRLRGPAELRLTDQAGNERVIPLNL